MELTVKTDEEALVVYAYKIFNKQVLPKLIHNECRVWIRSEYKLHGSTYVFSPDGKLEYANVPSGY